MSALHDGARLMRRCGGTLVGIGLAVATAQALCIAALLVPWVVLGPWLVWGHTRVLLDAAQGHTPKPRRVLDAFGRGPIWTSMALAMAATSVCVTLPAGVVEAMLDVGLSPSGLSLVRRGALAMAGASVATALLTARLTLLPYRVVAQPDEPLREAVAWSWRAAGGAHRLALHLTVVPPILVASAASITALVGAAEVFDMGLFKEAVVTARAGADLITVVLPWLAALARVAAASLLGAVLWVLATPFHAAVAVAAGVDTP